MENSILPRHLSNNFINKNCFDYPIYCTTTVDLHWKYNTDLKNRMDIAAKIKSIINSKPPADAIS